ncbi:MAG: nitrogen regulation protein NR(II) [Fidelibacterota bacterium]
MTEAHTEEPGKIKDYTTTIAILESIEDAVFFLSKTGRIQYTNRAAQKLLQRSLEELAGELFDSLIYYDGRKTDTLSDLLEKLKSGMLENLESRFQGKDQLIPVILNFSIVKDREGEAAYIIVTAKNISRQKQLEEKLREQQAVSISKDRMRALGEMSVGIIHEISQPLTTLRLKIELLQSQLAAATPEKIQEDLAEYLLLIQRIANTMDHMRTFAQQTDDDALGLVNLNDSIDNAHALIQYELDSHNIELRIEKDLSIPFCIANQLLIDQVLINLVNNSIDAFSNRSRKQKDKYVSVSTKAIDNKWVELTIRDNAGGIPQTILEKIFDPFFTTKPPEENSGLGLAISRNIIHTLGGEIKVSSQAGDGTTFVIMLPSGQNGERDQLKALIEMLHGG